MAGGGRRLGIDWAAAAAAARLKGLYPAATRRDVWPRLHTLWPRRRGRRIRAVAAVLGVQERTVPRWVRW